LRTRPVCRRRRPPLPARAGSGGLRRLQTGLVRNYALGIALGAVLLLLYIATRVTF